MNSYSVLLLKKVDYGERSIILQTYSKEEGSLFFFMNRPSGKGKSKALLSPLSFLEITAKKGKGDLLRVRDLKPASISQNLLSDVRKTCIVLFLNEVLIKALRDYQQDEALYDFLFDAMGELDEEGEHYLNFHLSFMMELSRHLGFFPSGKYEQGVFFDLIEGSYCSEPPLHNSYIPKEDAQHFGKLMLNRHLNDQQLKLNNDQRRILLGHLTDYYRAHIEGFGELKSRDVLEQIFS